MSTIGKILLALNLILAGAFLGWAANSLNKTEELKKAKDAEIAKLSKQSTELQSQLDSATSSTNTERSAKDAALAESRQYKSDAERLQSDLDAAKRANEGLRGDIAKISESVTGMGNQLEKIDREKTAALEAKAEAESARGAAERKAEAAEAAQRDAEEAKTVADMNIAGLEKALAQSRKETATVQTKYDTLKGITGVAEGDVTAMPLIEAQVVKVDYSLKPGLVALNVGKNAGVARGHTFEIYAGTEYKGQVKVETVTDDTCAALIVLSKGSAKMNAGDRASTRL
ncbi:MAG: hypothetical protein FJ298_03715 [Planctomycetes bacterium]|nr:hypothetical protein [Planctomycetota bacterium]